jgi:PAS domain S-box-containing protein
MRWHWSHAGVLTLAGGAFLAVVAAWVWRRRGASAATSLALVLLATSGWSLAYSLELGATSVGAKLAWGDLKYLGICLLPPAWYAFTMQYSGRGRWVNRRSLAVVAVEPALVLALLANRSTHDLIRYYPPGAAADPGAAAASGPLFWVHLAYTDLLLWSCTALFVWTLGRVSRLYRRQSRVLIVSVLVPWVANGLFNLKVGPFARVDLTPFLFTLTGVVLVWGIFRFRLLDLAPIARSSVFETIADGVLVLDPYHRVVKLNPAAERIVGLRAADVVGRPAERLLPTRPEALERLADTGGHAELLLGDGAGGRCHEVTVASLRDRGGRPTGWVLVLRDVTGARRAADRLRHLDEQRRFLLQRLVNVQEEERRRIAGDIHDDSIQAMTAVLYRLALLRKHADDPGQLGRIDALETAVGASLERLRTLVFDLRPPVLDEVGLVAALRQYLKEAEAHGGFSTQLRDRLTSEPPGELRVIAYRIAQEALTNVRSHARASTVEVAVGEAEGGLLVRIADDGTGFRSDRAEEHPRPGHLGLASMRERAAMAGGWCQIDSRPGRGTTVEFWLPAAAGDPA